MPTVIDCVQGDETWAEQRRGRATASRFKSLLTDKKCEYSKAGAMTYACELLAERLVPPHYWVGNDVATGPMRNGTLTEREARDYFAFQYGQEVSQVGLVVGDDEFYAASPDGLIGDDAGLELKCPTHAKQIRYLIDSDELLTDYRAQCHGGMIVTKRNRWYLMSYAAGLPPVVIPFTVDDYTLKLAEALAKFKELFSEMDAKISGLGDPVAATREPYIAHF